MGDGLWKIDAAFVRADRGLCGLTKRSGPVPDIAQPRRPALLVARIPDGPNPKACGNISAACDFRGLAQAAR